jgi:hypothetical protein
MAALVSAPATRASQMTNHKGASTTTTANPQAMTNTQKATTRRRTNK